MIKVFVTNISKYAEGNLIGEWINLPMDTHMLNGILKEKIQIHKWSEYFISDYSNDFGIIIEEYSDIHMLNSLASILNKKQDNKRKIKAFLDENYITNIEELIKVVDSSDNIPFYNFEFEGIENCDNMKPLEKYGYTKATNSGLIEKLSELNVEDYFDFELYGADDENSGYVSIFEDGFLDRTINIF